MSVLFALSDPGVAIPAFVLISLGLLVIGFLIWTRGGKLETNLILLGLAVAVAAFGYGSLVAGDVSVSVSQPPGSVAASFGGASLAAILMKLGVLMVLGGIAVGLLDKLPSSPPPDNRNTQG